MRSCPKCGKPYADDVQFCPTDGSALSPPQGSTDPLIGTLIDRYRIEEKLGEGGMGMVYRAEHTLIGRSVALKLLHPDLARTGEAVDRFFREARAANEVPNDHIVEVTDLGKTTDGKNYLVMELLSGTSLQDLLTSQGSLDPHHAGRIALQIADGLSAAHKKGVVHRDLKPANIQLVAKGEDPEFVKLLDFGIAKFSEGEIQLTKTGVILGSPAYMSPEQASGSKVDHRTDIYALGVILYEMVVGRPPFVGQSPTQVLLAHVSQQPAPPHDAVPDVPPLLESLILRCLAKEPSQRPQRMEQVIEQLNAWMKPVARKAPLAPGPMNTAFAATANGTGPGKMVLAWAPAPSGHINGIAPTLAANTGQLPSPALPAATLPVLISSAQPAQPATPKIPPTMVLPQMAAPAQSVATTSGVVTTQALKKPDQGLLKGIVLGGVLVAAVSAAFFIFGGGEKTAGEDKAGIVAKAPAVAKPAGEIPGQPPTSETVKPQAAVEHPAANPSPGNPPPSPPVKQHRKPIRSALREKVAEPQPSAPSQPQGLARPQVTIQSTPSGAQIFGGGSLLGTTPKVFYSERGFTVMLQQSGYQPAYLTARPNQGGTLTAQLKPLSEPQATQSLDRLKQLYRARQISRPQWKARIKELKQERDRRIRVIKEAYKRGQFTRAVRNQRIDAVNAHYR